MIVCSSQYPRQSVHNPHVGEGSTLLKHFVHLPISHLPYLHTTTAAKMYAAMYRMKLISLVMAYFLDNGIEFAGYCI